MRLALATLALTVAVAVPVTTSPADDNRPGDHASPNGGALVQTAALRYRRCRDVIIRTGDGTVYTRTNGLFASRTRCRRARKVARRYFKTMEGNHGARPRPYGFRCSGGDDGVACRKDRQRVTWGYYYD